MEKSENFENDEFGVILDPREQRRRLSLAIKERLENLTVKSIHQKGIFYLNLCRKAIQEPAKLGLA